MKLISNETKLLMKDMIDNYNDWNINQYMFSKNNTNIWICSGLFFIDIYPGLNSFNIFEKFMIRKTIGKSIALKAANMVRR